MFILIRKLIFAYLCLLILSACAFVPVQKNVLLFTYSLGEGDGMHLAYSRDGYKWTPLRNGELYLKPEVGSKLMRHPSLVEGREESFHLVWTTGLNDKGFGYTSSKDLINWTEQRFIPINEKLNAKDTWAPELYYQRKPKLFHIIWSTTIPGLFPETEKKGEENQPNHRLYSVTTGDFVSFSEPKIFFNPGYNCGDGSLIEANGKIQLIFRDERPEFNTFRISSTSRLGGLWGEPTEPITNLNGIEGPSAVKAGADWLIFFDHYQDNQYYGALRSRDFKQWEDVTNQISKPIGMKHGTVLRVTEKILQGLLKDSSKQTK